MALRPGGIVMRIAVAALIVAGLAIAILAVGVLVVGAQSFADLMAEHGDSTESSQQMFNESVGRVVVGTLLVASLVAIVVAAFLGARLAMPLRAIGRAARRIADGDYAARIPREGPEEIISLSDSFNQMAAALEEQERMRREFIANAAHELRTPLTNLQGYLEALRDGVIEPDHATFESLWDEAERLVRLSRSLDTLAAGDAGTAPAMVDVDLAAIIRSAVDLVRPGIIAGGIEVTVDVPSERQPAAIGSARPGAREPAPERRPLHLPTRSDHRPRRATTGRPPCIRREQRRRHPKRRPGSRLRALLSR